MLQFKIANTYSKYEADILSKTVKDDSCKLSNKNHPNIRITGLLKPVKYIIVNTTCLFTYKKKVSHPGSQPG